MKPTITWPEVLALLRQLRQRMGLHPIWGARAEPCEGVYEGMEE